jgi:hypothetical protein
VELFIPLLDFTQMLRSLGLGHRRPEARDLVPRTAPIPPRLTTP